MLSKSNNIIIQTRITSSSPKVWPIFRVQLGTIILHYYVQIITNITHFRWMMIMWCDIGAGWWKDFLPIDFLPTDFFPTDPTNWNWLSGEKCRIVHKKGRSNHKIFTIIIMRVIRATLLCNVREASCIHKSMDWKWYTVNLYECNFKPYNTYDNSREKLVGRTSLYVYYPTFLPKDLLPTMPILISEEKFCGETFCGEKVCGEKVL